MADPSEKPSVVLITRDTTGNAVTAFRAVAADDRFVRSRLASGEEEPPSQVITEFAPAAERPTGYPGWLPFLPGRPVFTTESPSGRVSPGARWPCRDDVDDVVAALTAQSVAAGWTLRPAEHAFVGGPVAETRAELTRGDRVRRLLVVWLDSGAIVQLLEGPASWFRAPRADGHPHPGPPRP